MLLQRLLCLLAGASAVYANVEKTIFLGPEPVNIPPHSPSLADLNIDVLTPDDFLLRTHVKTVFPTAELERGLESWYILDNLTEGQRYEVRICWLATQPTAFHLTTFPLPHVFETPDLITSLYNYSTSRQHPPSSSAPATPSAEREASLLLLRVSAAAEYFTTNATLMAHPEPVLVDLILDPFLGNVLPRTLAPTVGYIVCVAAVAWVLSTRMVMPWLRGLMAEGHSAEREEKKTQ